MARMGDTANKLRAEIQESKKMRHDFVLRKFAFSTALLGFGGLGPTTHSSGAAIDFSLLLYLVPVVAIAFDFYIVTEDYRIKRAGEFIRRGRSGAEDEEKDWEEFAKNKPNDTSLFAFGFVTIVYLVGAALILWQTDPVPRWFFFMWLVVVVLAEAIMLTYAKCIRSRFEKSGEGSKQDPITIIDELELRPGMLEPFLEAMNAEYRPGAEQRGLRLLHGWVTPPVELAGAGTRLLLVWQVDGVPGFWRMRSQNAAPEVARWWRGCERFVVSRSRRYAVEADALSRFAAAGRLHA